MEGINTNAIMFLVIVGFATFQGYSITNKRRQTKEVKARFKANNPNYETVNDAKLILGCLGVVIGLVVFLAVYNVIYGGDKWLTYDYAATALLALSTAFFSITKRTCLLGEKEFYADGKIAKYSQVKDAYKKGSTTYVVRTSMSEIETTSNIADILVAKKQMSKKMTKKYTK